MKILNYTLFFLLISFISSSCANDDSLTTLSPSTSDNENVLTRANSYNLTQPYITRPDISQSKDTTDSWVFDIRTDKYVNGELQYGKKGLYTQLQYCVGYNNWVDAAIQIENPIYLRKRNFPFGQQYFRARTMERESLSNISSAYQYQYASELSPWSEPLLAINNIYNGVSLTKNNVIIDITFTFNASYTGYLSEKSLSVFNALIICGGSSYNYTIKDKYLKKDGYKETYTLSINKYDLNTNGFSLTITDRCLPGNNISFNPQSNSLSFNMNEVTSPFKFNVNVQLR